MKTLAANLHEPRHSPRLNLTGATDHMRQFTTTSSSWSGLHAGDLQPYLQWSKTWPHVLTDFGRNHNRHWVPNHPGLLTIQPMIEAET